MGVQCLYYVFRNKLKNFVAKLPSILGPSTRSVDGNERRRPLPVLRSLVLGP